MRTRFDRSRPFLALAALGTLVACGSSEARDPSPVAEIATEEVAGTVYIDISPEETARAIASGNYLVVNVHIPYEGEIEGTDLNLAYDEIEQHLASLEGAKDGGLLLYCKSGRMSRIAADALAAHGFRDMLHLDGGMIAWEADGKPLVHSASGP
jgi:phage shock protein E